MLLAEFREIIRGDHLLSQLAGFHGPSFQPTSLNPLLHFANADVEYLSERFCGKPLPAHLRISAQPVQLRTD